MKRLLILFVLLLALVQPVAADVEPPPSNCPTRIVFNFFAEYGHEGCATGGTVIMQLSPGRSPLSMATFTPVTVNALNQKWGKSTRLAGLLVIHTWANPYPFQNVYGFDLTSSPGLELLIVRTAGAVVVP